MQSILLRPYLVVVALGIVGCQALPSKSLEMVVPIYSEKSEALAVASGQFGAVPIAIAGDTEIEAVLSVPCIGQAVAVQFREGRRGWIPMESLPRKLQASSGCSVEKATQSVGATDFGKPRFELQLQR